MRVVCVARRPFWSITPPTGAPVLAWRKRIWISRRCTSTVWRGPALGGACLGIDTDSSETRGSEPIAARSSIRCVPVMVRALRRIKPEGTHKKRSQTRIALAMGMFPSAAHGDVDGTTNNEWSDRDLQVFDLKAAVTLSSTCVIEAGRTGSRRIMLAVACMHHAPSRGHRRRLRGGRQTDMNPSIPRVATLSDVARHRTRCTATARRSDINAEPVAMEKAASADHRVRRYGRLWPVLRHHSGHSGVMPAATKDDP